MKDNRIESLRPEVQAICRMWLHVCKDDLGLNVRILETLRSRQRQEELVEAGASLIKLGSHNLGCGWDFGCFTDGGVYITDGKHPDYERAGIVGELLGCVWGGRWAKLVDSGHLELRDWRRFLDEPVTV